MILLSQIPDAQELRPEAARVAIARPLIREQKESPMDFVHEAL